MIASSSATVGSGEVVLCPAADAGVSAVVMGTRYAGDVCGVVVDGMGSLASILRGVRVMSSTAAPRTAKGLPDRARIREMMSVASPILEHAA
jgi:hypothetical protein